MWVVELTFNGAPERLAARAAHREKLMRLHEDGIVKLAGPLADDSGAIIVFDVPGRTELDELMAKDPYFTTNGVTVSHVRQWAPFIS
jgi:uncharacterized protein YciI